MENIRVRFTTMTWISPIFLTKLMVSKEASKRDGWSSKYIGMDAANARIWSLSGPISGLTDGRPMVNFPARRWQAEMAARCTLTERKNRFLYFTSSWLSKMANRYNSSQGQCCLNLGKVLWIDNGGETGHKEAWLRLGRLSKGKTTKKIYPKHGIKIKAAER